MKITIYFATSSKSEIARIRSAYSINGILSVNGEIECELDEATLSRLRKDESGLIQIRNKI